MICFFFFNVITNGMRFGILHLNAYLVILGETSGGQKTKEEKKQ